VLRAPDGRVELAGQYVRNGSFIEFSVSRELLAEFVPDPYNEQILFELATSRRVGERVERFTITTIEGRELLAP
jgi:hypothetical protein